MDEDILNRVRDLMDEEHQIRAQDGPHDPSRLQHIEETLDQCWDLLRQRRARRDAGQDPDEAEVRPGSVVEHYQQ